MQVILEEEQLKKTRNLMRKAHRNRSKKIVKKVNNKFSKGNFLSVKIFR